MTEGMGESPNSLEQSGSLPWDEFLSGERLPADYRELAERWFLPLVDAVVDRHRALGRPVVVGINGCQGSGKSTLAAFLAFALPRLAGLSVARLSLDDFYLPRSERKTLARWIHPLLETRGVPGTHDVELMGRVMSDLVDSTAEAGTTVALPQFDKALDDRTDVGHWHRIGAPVDVLIWEGWCLGVEPQPSAKLADPVNDLEAKEDLDGAWRKHANRALAGRYQELFGRVDLWVMLQAPDFRCVYQWRLEQEEKLASGRASGSDSRIMSAADIARFIQFYQRLTEWALATLPHRMHWLYRLDRDRRVTALTHPQGALPV